MEKMKVFRVDKNYGGKRTWRIEPFSKENLQRWFGGESICNYYWDIFKSQLNDIIKDNKGAIAFEIEHSNGEHSLYNHLLFTYGYSIKDARDVVDEISHEDFKTNEYLKYKQDLEIKEEEIKKRKHEEEIEHENEINDQSRPIKIVVNKLPKYKEECPFYLKYYDEDDDGFCKLMEEKTLDINYDWDNGGGYYDSGPSLNSITPEFHFGKCPLKNNEPGIKCPCLQALN